MILYLHEMRRSRLSLIIWSAALSFMILTCVFIYPMMKDQMAEMSEMFADMGAFSSALGMDEFGFGDFFGYFALECGEVLGMGGAVFAAIIGIGAISKEEKGNTAQFLLTHPVSRSGVVLSKYLAVLSQITLLSGAVWLVTAASVLAIGEEPEAKKMVLLFLSYYILQVEIASVTFGISAFIRGRGMGIGIGLALMLYFVGLIANITEETEFLKYVTPFAYTNGNYIVENSALETKYVIIGLVVTVACVVLAFLKYRKKDIL